jgi:hypothetical protein
MAEEEGNLRLLVVGAAIFLHVASSLGHLMLLHVVGHRHRFECLIGRPSHHIVVPIACRTASDGAIIAMAFTFAIEVGQIGLVYKLISLLELRRVVAGDFEFEVHKLLSR